MWPYSASKTKLNRREFLKYSGLALATVGLGGCRAFQTHGERDAPFFFLHMADPQLFMGPLELWEMAITHANQLKPSFVVVGGDLINTPRDVEMTNAYLKVAASLDPQIPLYNVAGNHDVGNVPTRESLAWYQQHFGELWYSFVYHHVLCIVLESNILRSPQEAPEIKTRQMAWLAETLQSSEATPARQKIVFMHHPMCIADVREPDGYFPMPLDVRAVLLEMFHAGNVTAVFSGHYHRNAYVNDGGLELITTSSSGKPLGDDPPGFRVVKVYPDRIEHEYYGFERMPTRVEL